MKSLKKLLFSSETSDYLWTIIASFFHAFSLFVYGIFARHEIAPLQYGIFVTASLFSTYMGFAQLGVLNSFNRDYPLAVGAKDEKRKETLVGTTFWYMTLLYFILGIAVSVVMLLLNQFGKVQTDLFLGVALICISVFFTNMSSILSGVLKSNGRYKRVAASVIVSTCAQVVVGVLCILFLGYWGLYFALIANALAGMLVNRRAFKTVRLVFDWSLLKSMFIYGIPLLLNSLVWSLNASMDQFVILGFSTQESLGIYSVAQTVFSIMMLVPQSISQVLYVKLSNTYGETDDERLLLKKTGDFSKLLSWSSGAIAAIGIAFLPAFVRILMPQYVDGVFSAQILCVGVAFYGATMLYGNVFSVLKENSKLLFSSVMLCVISLSVSLLLVWSFGFSLSFVGIGTSVSYFVYSIVLVGMLSYYHKVKFWENLLKIWMPIITLLFPVILFVFVLKNELISMIFSVVWVGLVSLLYYKKGGK